MTNDILQLGGIVALFALMIRELFSYLKSRKEGGNHGNPIMESMLKELRIMNENHLHSLKDSINIGNDRIVDAINSSSVKQIELLGRIEGRLDNRK